MSSTMKHYRRQYYIRGTFQRRFILRFCSLVIAGCVVFGVALYLYGRQTLTTAFVNSRLRVVSTADYLLPALGWATLVIGLCSASACAVAVLLLSHKIAGPLYRLEKIAQAVGNGDLAQTVRLREHDELKTMASAMDGMMQQLRTRITSVKKQAKMLETKLQLMNRAAEVSAQEMPHLQDEVQQLNRLLEQFRS